MLICKKGMKKVNFEKIINYTFKNKTLLDTALTHSSYAHENEVDYYNERIEYFESNIIEEKKKYEWSKMTETIMKLYNEIK